MSEVSLEAESGKTSAEDPQMECEETDKAEESLNDDATPEIVDSSRKGEEKADVLYEININSDEENTESCDKEMDKGTRAGNVSSSVGSKAKHQGESAETSKGSGDSLSETKESTMADSHRGSAAEIPVTSNGDLDQSPESVFQRDSHSTNPGAIKASDSSLTSSNFESTAEGIIESGPYKDTMKAQPTSGAVVLSDDLKNPAMEKLDLVRKWSINTYKCTRQILSEKLGRGSKTVDLELEAQIELLRENKRKYQIVIKLAQALANQLSQIMQTQRQLGDAFADLSLKSPELHEEFGYNADTQKLLSKNGETLLAAINFFISSVDTLVDKTIEDTMINIKQYEAARIEYDAYRTDFEELNLGPRDGNTMPKIEQSQQQFQIHREKFERMRNDVSVKLKFLEENKVKVLHNQLILFHNAIAAYYAGNQQQLEQTLKQFHIKLKVPGGESPSWLEEH
ncbi:PREDICTED: arfaptin-1 isoform X2 [Cyprinodon variegatus]|uniref:ADP-ribosylation factor interacting protein 1 (arfaptin 1) n=1 Tax=Cyprinodon variegatus TaxID=28743 RepID=A0A3Q2EB55_CYPVA|nr:PREDICTED: arfaptin-1 isoform X2 [Cyprinodon variegatus]